MAVDARRAGIGAWTLEAEPRRNIDHLRHSTGYKFANDGQDTRGLAPEFAIDSAVYSVSAWVVRKVLDGLKRSTEACEQNREGPCSLLLASVEPPHLVKWAAWGLSSPDSGSSGRGSPVPVSPRAFELYSIMPHASGKALLVVMCGMFLDDCGLYATQEKGRPRRGAAQDWARVDRGMMHKVKRLPYHGTAF